ncbi:MAG: NUDIX domain-containing protein [Patescibacteria group bacterium]
MTQKVVRTDQVVLPEEKSFGWQPVHGKDGQVVAFENPRFGRFEHIAFVDGDSGAFLYDGMRKLDGPINEDGHANPGVIFVVVEDREDGIYLHCQEEIRPLIYDHIEGVQGVKCIGFAGGFSHKGEKPNKAALRELLSEQGIEVETASVERIGYASDNRASTETCIEVFLGKFSRMITPVREGHEIILKSVLVRIDQFIPGLDGIVNSAYAMVVSHLGLVKQK